MIASELKDLIIRKLAKENGGGLARWRQILGELKVYPRSTHAHCNWDVRPSGAQCDVVIAERAIDAVRVSHPFVG
ncbi:hypothetical protein [Sphingomonas sp. ID0503]|uniref:hypothetical protein n=1 Tax=Sphingomonas sp. ID0503 TaxID=3399691 RepID=UPI003AFA8DD3